MFLILGFRMRPSNVSEGDFFCPRCGADRRYVLQRFRRWFTLFFLPMFPLSGAKGEHVKCTTCNTAFRTEVLQTPTSATLSDVIRDAMRLAAVAMLNAGNASEFEPRQVAANAIAATGAAGYNDADLCDDMRHQDQSRLPAYVDQLARGLNDQGKEMFITRLAGIAVASGPVSERERALLDTIGSGLGMSATHVLGIVTAVASIPRH